MQIRTSLKLSTIILLFVFLALASLIVVSFQLIDSARLQRSLTTDMLVDINNLRGLTLEYLLYPNERGEVQLFSQISMLQERLEFVIPVNPDEEMLIFNLKEDNKQLVSLLQQLTANSNGAGIHFKADTQLQDLLIGQITIVSQRIISGALELSKSSEQRMYTTLNAAYVAITISSFIQLFIVLFIIFFLFNRKIFKPLIRLENATHIVSRGNLDYKVPITNYNEVGRLSKSFNTMVERLKGIDEIKARFLSTAAHQLRTPIGAIRWNAEILLKSDKVSAKEKHSLLNDIHDSSIRLSKTIDELLDASRIERGKIIDSPQKVDFLELIEAVVKDLKYELEKRKITVKIERSVRELPEVLVDMEKMFEILMNLISNAVIYSNPGGTVVISGSLDQDRIEVAVSDAGIGISKDDYQKVFSKFYRSKQAMEKEPNGMGIGLFIAKSYLESWGGELNFSSELEKGSTFRIRLPENMVVKGKKVLA